MHQRHIHNPSIERAVMSLALQHCIDALDVYESKARNSVPIFCSLCHLGCLQTKPCHQKEKPPSHSSLTFSSLWDGTNITYGRHHPAAEWLPSPGSNNSTAVGLIKRNGTNYGPIPAWAIMFFCTLVPVTSPDQYEIGREDRVRDGRFGRNKLPSNNHSDAPREWESFFWPWVEV